MEGAKRQTGEGERCWGGAAAAGKARRAIARGPQKWALLEGAAAAGTARRDRAARKARTFLMLNVLRISSGVLPLIRLATLAHARSRRGLMSM